MLEYKIREVLKKISEKYSKHTKWVSDSVIIEKDTYRNSVGVFPYYKIIIYPVPKLTYLIKICKILNKELKLYIQHPPVVHQSIDNLFIIFYPKKDNKLKILLRPEKIREIWQV